MAGVDVGDPAPSFELPDAEGKVRTLEEFRGSPLVLYFYPGDFTPGCTKEACSFQERLDEFDAKGARVVGVSPDPPGKHKAFRDRYSLSFPLLADEDQAVASTYGVKGLLRTSRVTFVIDADGRVVERVASLFPGPHIQRALEALGQGVSA